MTDAFREEIVIVGMAGRFPGAGSVAEFWANLRNGVESIRRLSPEELAAAGVDPVRAASEDYVPAAAPLEHADAFDASFFGYTPRDAQIMDPQHRVFLECAWSALEDAGYDPAECPGSVGLFGGVGPNTYRQQVLETRPDVLGSSGRYPLLIGSEREYAISRAAFKLGLKGPVVAVATACSTSGVALHLAYQSVLSGECDMALAGGARVAVPLTAGYTYEEDGILSPDGHCRTFDADARGTVVGSGVAIVVLKRLSDARRDGDAIRAIIKGTAINNDGSDKIGFTAPSVSGQETVIRQALEMADVSASSIGYVEAHGTGTFLGDPIEVEALTRAYRADTDAVGYCGIGSVKTNIGHLDAGAGVAGVVKATLALESGEIPPSLNFSAPNPQIDFEASPFRVVDRLTAWPRELLPRRAAVSSFGLGGTNAHIILEQPPAADPSSPSTRDHHLFVVSGRTEPSLERATRALAERLERGHPLEPADVAHTLAVGRHHQRRRRAVVASDCGEAARALLAAVERPVGEAVSDRPTVFMFPGGGAQYVGMGQRLYATEPAFRRAFDRCADRSEQSLGANLRALVFGAGDPGELERPAIALPALFATEYAMARLLESLAVRPSIMIGHSLGEYTAACLAGVMSLEDALALVALRGRLFEELPPGAMISVQLPAADLERRIGDDLSIAAINKPDLCTVAGSDRAIRDLEQGLARDGVETRRLRIAVAAHSHLVEPILARFGEFAATITLSEPRIPIVSNLTGTVVGPGEATRPEYWVRHLRSTVRFVEGLATALKGETKLAVEVGPGQTLSGFARQHPARVDGHVVVPTLPHPSEKTPDDAFFLAAVGKLWAAGAPVELASLHAGEQRLRVPLPTYPFERDRHWIEGAAVRPAQLLASDNAQTNGDEAIPRQPEPVASPAPRDRPSRIRERLLEDFSALSGMSAEELDTQASFLELGFDSLFMTQAASVTGAAFGLKVSFRHLLEEAPTLDALARWLDERLPEEQVPPPAQEAIAESRVPGLHEIAAQLAAIQRQVSALSSGEPSTAATIDSDSGMPDATAGPPPAEPTGPWRPPERRTDDLDSEQLRHLHALTERLTSRTGGSKAATASNRGHLADPRTVAGFRRTWKEIVYPVVVDRSAGSKLWDIDGNEYLDVAMGFGVNLFGHSPPFVIDAVTSQLARGIEIGPQTPLAGETAALIADMTGHERVAFCNTGSEAVLAAMRLARTVTGRSKIVTFANDYHGLFDEVLARGVLRDGQRRSLPIAPGIPAHAAQDLIIFDYGDPEALRYVSEHASELAAVLVEPVQSRYPEVRPVEFLHELRRSTAASGVALVFDEMITGFRAHPGGAQALFDIRADLATYGKVIGGGFPIGVVAGTAHFMDALDGGGWQYGDDSIPEADVTWFAGTFVRHPVALAASRAVLQHLRAAGPRLQADLNARTTAFADGLNAYLQELEVPIRIEHFSSLFLTRFSRDQEFASLFYFHLRDQGVHITEGRGAFLSTAHSDADLARLDAAYRAAASAMQSAGFLSGARRAPSRSEVRELPVTEGQQEILLAASLSTAANCSYNLANTLHITGQIDVDALRRALDRVIARHEALRVTFTADLERQRIADELPLELSVVDLSDGDREAREAALAERRDAEVETPFDLQAGPLVRAALLRMAAEEHHLFLTIHHAVCDGWSSGTVLRNLVKAYTAERRGTAVTEAPAMQLSEYVDWFDRYLSSADRSEDERFWAARVTPDFPKTELPPDKPRATRRTYGARRKELPLDRKLVADLRALAAAEGTTLFALLLSSFECLLARLTRSSEVALGVTIGGHSQFPGRELVAHCVNLLPLRRPVDADLSFSRHLATTQTAILDAFEHQNLSYGAIVRASGIRRDPTRTPLVTVTFNMDTPSDRLDMDGAVAIPGSNPRHFENFDFFLNIAPRGDELVMEVTYNTDLFEAATLDRWLSYFDTLLRAVVARPESALDALPVLDNEQRLAVSRDGQPEVASKAELPFLPFDRPDPVGAGSERDVVSVAVSASDRVAGVSGELLALAAWVVVLATYSGRSSLCVDVATGGAVVPVDVEADPGLSFADLAGLLSRLVDGAESSASVGPALFVLEGDDEGLDASVVLRLESGAGEDRLTASFDVARFERPTVFRILGHVEAVLAQAVASAGAVRVGEVGVVPAEELALLESWNATRVEWDRSATLVSLFGAVGGGSAAVAVQFGSRELSYAELERLARRVAGRLVELGVGRGSLVGVLCERSVELVAALHGVVMAGAAYVPLDPEYPPDRLEYMAAETGMRVVLCQGALGGLVERADVTLVDLERLLAGDGDADFAPVGVEPDDLAYVIYTSGSTGRPKGVANAHRGVANRLLWIQDRFGLGPGDVVLLKTPISFDVSVWELFWPLQVGARLVIAEPGGHRDPAYLVQAIVGHGVDTIHFVPSMLRLFLEHPDAGSCTSLRRVICSGEALTRDLQDRFLAVLPDAELHNLYGLTEAPTAAAWQCRREDSRRVVPIGAPIANVTIRILDDQLKPVPIGIPGELHIGGVQVAAGYVNQPDLTAERFVPDPFDPPGRLYKTGDLARWLPDGQVDFLGRLDHQVKLRGQRIELGEIEAVLRQHPDVAEVVVVASEFSPGDQRLVAYFTPSRDASTGLAETLRAKLRSTLPEYMLPSHFVSLAAIPLTPSGKVDKKSLPAPGLEAMTTGTEHVAPRTPTESRIATIWADALEMASPGIYDDFFDLGGHSLTAAQIVITLRSAFQVDVAMRHLFERPTIAGLAEIIDVLAVSGSNGGREPDDARRDREELEI